MFVHMKAIGHATGLHELDGLPSAWIVLVDGAAWVVVFHDESTREVGGVDFSGFIGDHTFSKNEACFGDFSPFRGR
jgi:hypothetical protein